MQRAKRSGRGRNLKPPSARRTNFGHRNRRRALRVRCGLSVRSFGPGRLRAPPVADTASKKEWQNQGDWRVCFAHDDRAADSTDREAGPYGSCRRQLWADRVVRPYKSDDFGRRAVREAGPYGCGGLCGRMIAAPTDICWIWRTESSAPTNGLYFEPEPLRLRRLP